MLFESVIHRFGDISEVFVDWSQEFFFTTAFPFGRSTYAKNHPFLWFDNNAEEAVQFYTVVGRIKTSQRWSN